MFFFQKIFIDQSVVDAPLTRRIRAALPGTAVEILPTGIQPPPGLSLRKTKKILYLTSFQGQGIKPCPGTREYICCGYQILNTATNCPMDCTYCILQSYFNQSGIRLFANLDDIFSRLIEYGKARAGQVVRLGTGEFTDSLALDPLTGFSTALAETLRAVPNVIVELKTKSRAIANLLRLEDTGQLVVSWSLNPDAVIRREEHGAASLMERLEAARACQDKGFRLGFHFDPIFYYDGWEPDYRETVEQLFRRIRPEGIAWISLGCFRFMPSLVPIVRTRFPQARFMNEEFIPARDGKKRYPQPLRVEMYRRLAEWITDRAGAVGLYLCMENSAVWRQVFGFVPGEGGHPPLSEMLDERIR